MVEGGPAGEAFSTKADRSVVAKGVTSAVCLSGCAANIVYWSVVSGTSIPEVTNGLGKPFTQLVVVHSDISVGVLEDCTEVCSMVVIWMGSIVTKVVKLIVMLG